MVPHIVFNPAIPTGAYFPGPERWGCAELAAAAPTPPPHTSGIAQPPVHAIAALHIRRVAERKGEADLAVADGFLRDIYPRMFAWHRFLATARDPEASGLVTIYHPWCGTDNSPRWDRALEAVTVGELEPYVRADLQHVADPSQRPTKAEYDRYLWLVEELKRARYDDAEIQRTHPFLIKDVLFTRHRRRRQRGVDRDRRDRRRPGRRAADARGVGGARPARSRRSAGTPSSVSASTTTFARPRRCASRPWPVSRR